MASIEVVGKLFTNGADFLAYLQALKWGAWRPKYVTVHHTASPDLATWNGYQKATGKRGPITDDQWLRNLGVYYANPQYSGGKLIKGAWSAGPHFFVTPAHIGVLTPPTTRGIHAASFNHNSWGVEIVGYYDKGSKDDWQKSLARPLALEALAAMHAALGIEPDAPFSYAKTGLHFHRDDRATSKTCPGTQIEKPALIVDIERLLARLTDATPSAVSDDHPEEKITPKVPNIAPLPAVVFGVAAGDFLNVRADASARSPIVRTLINGDKVAVEGHKMNGQTKWLDIGDDEWVTAQFVRLEEAKK